MVTGEAFQLVSQTSTERDGQENETNKIRTIYSKLDSDRKKTCLGGTLILWHTAFLTPRGQSFSWYRTKQLCGRLSASV
ncbi:hypothetical protein EPR50_G00131220 [Perca flavescens]|uniref:Uncharacterized protein n=1 Tax=Perca flavescens TaxID=8167 RepID=A0A484CRW6_PERFV|nr:hypothetical protein EPR50_G00131220 [Perca flavescens]